MLKNCLLTALLSGFFISAFAQNEVDALRYSQRQYQVSARSLGMANAYSAVGGDYSAASLNPAGLGFYNRSELFISPAIRSITTNSTYLGNLESDRRANINIGSIGYVASTNLNQGSSTASDWKAYSLAIGFSRSMNFHEEIFYSGENNDHSVTYNYAELARGIPEDEIGFNSLQGLAYYTFLIDPAPNNTYTPVIKDSMDLMLEQENSIRKRGSINDINISVAGNYMDRLYLGGTIAFPFLSYKQSSTFKEFNLSPGSANYQSMALEQTFSTSGIGVMMALGGIFRVTDEYRVGLSMQTPTFFNLRDRYNTSMSSRVRNTPYLEESDPGSFRYSLTTPFRLTLGNVYQIQKSGIVSFDYELVNYSAASLDSRSYDFQDENNKIRRDYRSSHGFRLGAEYRFDSYYTRGGVNHYTSPFGQGLMPANANNSRTSFAFGGGLREVDYFIDAAAHFSFTNTFHLPYDIKDRDLEIHGAVNKVTDFTFLFSIGTRW